MRIEGRVALLLPAVGVELLAEVALPVEQADAGERDAEAARRLEVVAGEDAEAAAVLRERLGDAELGAEVGDVAQRARRLAVLEPPVGLEVAAQVAVDLGQEGGERGVLGQLLEPLATDEAEQPHRVVSGHLPLVGVDPAEQVAGAVVPRPAQVHGQLVRAAARAAGSLGRTVKLRSAFIAGPR